MKMNSFVGWQKHAEDWEHRPKVVGEKATFCCNRTIKHPNTKQHFKSFTAPFTASIFAQIFLVQVCILCIVCM